MKLYLVQHAKAEVKDGETSRTLTEEGVAELLKVASFLKIHAMVSIHTIYHSNKIRAIQTAEILFEHIKPKPLVKQASGLAPMDDVLIWAEQASHLSEDSMIVGHMPHISKLTHQLLANSKSGNFVSVRNAGVICLERDSTDQWSLRWSIIPEILK
ncbi:MAG: phosphohistidine phosphatase SixA [candidate division Zixibacteria bacterium]|nr:phosphohistidine phosphatase SixA [candidate division Zixibacteria bacterium]